jgi:hypothetical protein
LEDRYDLLQVLSAVEACQKYRIDHPHELWNGVNDLDPRFSQFLGVALNPVGARRDITAPPWVSCNQL